MSNDFSGKIGGEAYDQKVKKIPGFMEMQKKVAVTLGSYFPDKSKSIKVLDIGCGTGITSLKLREIRGNMMIHGVDQSEMMLSTFMQRLYEAGYSWHRRPTKDLNSPKPEENIGIYPDVAIYWIKDLNAWERHQLRMKVSDEQVPLNEPYCSITLICTSAIHYFTSIPKSGHIDAVVSAAAIHNMHQDYRKELFKEIYRVLTPGGLFIEADKIAVDDYAQHISDLAEELKLLDNLPPEQRAEWLAHYEFDEQPGIKLTESDLEKTLKDTGFQDIKKVWRQGLNAVYTAQKPR